MAVYDISDNGTTAATSHGGGRGARYDYLVERTVDISKVANGAGVAAADVIRVIDIPAETDVIDVGMEVVTAMTGTAPDVDVGWGTDTDEWVDGNNGAAGYATRTAQQLPLRFTSADTIDILFNTNAATAGKLRVWAVLRDISGKDETGNNVTSRYNTAV